MSTGRVTALPLAIHHCFSCWVSSVFVAFPSMANGVTASFPSHLTSSFAQFLTKLEGQAMTHFWIVGFPASGDCLSKVHMSVIH